MISGHWEAPAFTVQTNPNPPMVYDYGGFPEHTYHIEYPAPGSPALAARVAELLTTAGIPVREDARRGYDHGMYAPLAPAGPDADIPVVQLKSEEHTSELQLLMRTSSAVSCLKKKKTLSC